jgi:hypothetical protein
MLSTFVVALCLAQGPAPESMAGGDGLDEVNALRASRGLRPFLRDEGLTVAARGASAYRAQYGLFGHTTNDFGFVPAGIQCSSAGCAAYPPHYGWMSCCVYEGYTRAGAYWTLGRDGRRFMHLFVGHGAPALVGQAEGQPAFLPECVNGSCATSTAMPATCAGCATYTPWPDTTAPRRGFFRRR